MVLSLEQPQEIQFILYVITIVIGYQVAAYFFSQYLKIRDPNVKLNRILLAFTFFIILMITGFSILTFMRFFIADMSTREFFYKLGYLPILFSPIIFLYFIDLKELEPLINQRIVKILIGINFIPILLNMAVETTQSLIFRGSLVITMITAIYIVIFQIRLIQRAVGTFKKRFLQIFLGEILCFLGMLASAEIPTSFYMLEDPAVLNYLGIIVLIMGFLVALLAFYDFPPLYEFEWRNNLSKLFIIDQNTNQTVYFFDFEDLLNHVESREKVPQKREDIIFSKGLSGIEDIISKLTNSNSEKISKIKQGESMIFLEYSHKPKDMTYAVFVKKDLNSFRHFLNRVRVQFESLYKEVLESLNELPDRAGPLFESFDPIMSHLIDEV